MAYEDDILAEAHSALAELRSALDEVRELTAHIIDEGREQYAEDDERDERRAQAARRGDLGPDWRTLQQRLDRGETTLGAIARGGDDSPEADAVREHAIVNIADLARQLRAAEAEEEGRDLPEIHIAGAPTDTARGLPPEARLAMAQARATQARLDALTQRIREIPVEDPEV